MASTSRYPRETVEFVPFVLTVDGAAVTDGVGYALTTTRQRPTSWSPAQILEDRTGVLMEGLALGTWHVWARVTSSPEVPVVHCGTFEVV